MTIEEAFGIVIRRLRKERLLSQDGLSKTSSLDRGFISQLERGKQQPTLITIFELASALNVSAARILFEAELLLGFRRVKLYRHDLKLTAYEKLWEQLGGNPMDNNSAFSGTETILLVDDELYLRHFLSELLASQGYKVILAEDGQEALLKYKEYQDCVDLVLMDIMMPRKDGVTAHKEISEINPNAKILLMSGYSSVSLGNIDDLKFIQKPMLPETLFLNIRELLDSGSKSCQSAAGD